MNPKELARNLKNNKVFIYPGDEAYEIICDINARESVERLLKLGIEGIFSIISGRKSWILDNLEAKKHYIDRLPGPFTLIFKVKKQSKLVKYAINDNKVAVRMIRNDLSHVIKKNNIILFSCMLKKKGKLVIDSSAISRSIRKSADFIIDDGVLAIKPHVVIDLTGKIARIVK